MYGIPQENSLASDNLARIRTFNALALRAVYVLEYFQILKKSVQSLVIRFVE